uniref:Uncharacterized protein n=1 Tax=Panagrolaimus sp. ES5 TaxID=591445 RepID=A0AC34FP54_9BILA
MMAKFFKTVIFFVVLFVTLISAKPQIAASLGLGGVSLSAGPGATAGQGLGGAVAGNGYPVGGPVVGPVDPVLDGPL